MFIPVSSLHALFLSSFGVLFWGAVLPSVLFQVLSSPAINGVLREVVNLPHLNEIQLMSKSRIEQRFNIKSHQNRPTFHQASIHSSPSVQLLWNTFSVHSLFMRTSVWYLELETAHTWIEQMAEQTFHSSSLAKRSLLSSSICSSFSCLFLSSSFASCSDFAIRSSFWDWKGHKPWCHGMWLVRGQ